MLLKALLESSGQRNVVFERKKVIFHEFDFETKMLRSQNQASKAHIFV